MMDICLHYGLVLALAFLVAVLLFGVSRLQKRVDRLKLNGDKT